MGWTSNSWNAGTRKPCLLFEERYGFAIEGICRNGRTGFPPTKTYTVLQGVQAWITVSLEERGGAATLVRQWGCQGAINNLEQRVEGTGLFRFFINQIFTVLIFALLQLTIRNSHWTRGEGSGLSIAPECTLERVSRFHKAAKATNHNGSLATFSAEGDNDKGCLERQS